MVEVKVSKYMKSNRQKKERRRKSQNRGKKCCRFFEANLAREAAKIEECHDDDDKNKIKLIVRILAEGC